MLQVLVYGAAKLSAESTIEDWDLEFDLFGGPDADEGHFLDALFGIELTDAELAANLRPHEARTLGELARFIATKGPRAFAVVPLRIAGQSSLEAGAFRALDAQLEERRFRGTARPSTPTSRVVRSEPFLSALALVAPGRFLVVDAAPRRTLFLVSTGLAAGVATGAGILTGNPLLLLGGAVGIVGSVIAARFIRRLELRSRGGAAPSTVGEICRAIAREQARLG